MGLFDRKKYIDKKNFIHVVDSLVRSFEQLREAYIFGSMSQLKREGLDVSHISRDIVSGSELEDILKGFQLTSMMGIALNYIKDLRDKLDFSKSLHSAIQAEEGSRAWRYNDRYLDCKGDIDALAKALSVDVHRAIGFPEPKIEFLIQLHGGAESLIGMCQVKTYTACGDDNMARNLKKKILDNAGSN